MAEQLYEEVKGLLEPARISCDDQSVICKEKSQHVSNDLAKAGIGGGAIIIDGDG